MLLESHRQVLSLYLPAAVDFTFFRGVFFSFFIFWSESDSLELFPESLEVFSESLLLSSSLSLPDSAQTHIQDTYN